MLINFTPLYSYSTSFRRSFRLLRSRRRRRRRTAPCRTPKLLSGLSRASPLFVRLCPRVSLLERAYLWRVAPSLELSLPARLDSRELQLQLQLHARWGYAGLGRVRCTSRPYVRPSVCPRPASSLPSVSLVLPPSLHRLLLCPPSSSTLLSSSSSSFSCSSSFLLILARSATTSPFQVAGRDALHASRC